MGTGTSKEIESEEINIDIPVNAPHLGSEQYSVHEVHSGTVKAMCLILLITLMSIVLCVIAVKRLCKNMKVMTHQPVMIPKKNVFPDI